MKITTTLSVLLCVAMMASACTRKRSHRLTEIPAQVAAGDSVKNTQAAPMGTEEVEKSKIIESANKLSSNISTPNSMALEISNAESCDILDQLTSGLTIAAMDMRLELKELDAGQCLMTINSQDSVIKSHMADCLTDEEKFIEVIDKFKQSIKEQIEIKTLEQLRTLTTMDILTNLCINKTETVMQANGVKLKVVPSSNAKECILSLEDNAGIVETVATLDDACALTKTIENFKKMAIGESTKTEEQPVVVEERTDTLIEQPEIIYYEDTEDRQTLEDSYDVDGVEIELN